MLDWLSRVGGSDAPALTRAGNRLTYAELDEAAAGRAGGLAAQGVRRGDRLALWAVDPVTLWAVARLGAVGVHYNARWTPDEAEAAPVACRYQVGAAPLGLPQLEEADGPPPIAVEHDPADIHSVFFTSGSAGAPKAVPLTWANLEASATAVNERLAATAGDVWQLSLPLFHVGGFAVLVRAALSRSEVVVADYDELRDGVTLISLVPTMLHRLVQAGRSPPATLRLALVGGTAISPALLVEAAAAGWPVAPTYGMTEAGSQVATLLPGDSRTAAGAVGRPLTGLEVDVRGSGGQELMVGDEGEIWIRGPMVFAGYLGEEPLPAGWHRTGDLGRRDQEGYLYVGGRRHDVIRSGSETVHPAEVEAVLEAHPDVVRARVRGEADAEWGQIVVAEVVPAAEPLDTDALDSYVRTRLAGFKAPKRWEVVEELPPAKLDQPNA